MNAPPADQIRAEFERRGNTVISTTSYGSDCVVNINHQGTTSERMDEIATSLGAARWYWGRSGLGPGYCVVISWESLAEHRRRKWNARHRDRRKVR